MILETNISDSQLREIIRIFETVFFFNFEWSFFCMKQIKYIRKKITQISNIHNIQNGNFFNRGKKSRSRT